MYQINRADSFIKKAKKFFKKHPELKEKFKNIILKLQTDPFEASLKMHKLQGELKDFYACSLSYEYRLVISIIIIDKKIYLMDIGSHDEVY
jgi:addiction module RelE/StbE family toxin